MVQIIFQRQKCIGCNGCVEAAPERWRMSRKDGRCNLIGSKDKKGMFQVLVSEEEYERNVKAAINCPVKIIHVKII